MKKNRRFIYVIVGSFMIFIVGLFIAKYVMVNQKYPEAIFERYNIGEVLEYDGCDVSVKDFVILDKEKAKDLGYYLDDDLDYKILKCTMEVTNNSDIEKSPELYYVEAESSVWHNGVDLEVLHNANEATESLRPTLHSGETTTVTVVFVMYKFQFSNARWKQIDSDNLQLVFSLYPVKKYVVLQE